MAEIDTSIYPKAQPPGNGLDMAGQIVGIRNALLQGQQQQQQLQRGQIAIGSEQYDLAMKHYQGSIAFFSNLYARPNLTKADMIQAGADAVNMGLADPRQVSVELAGMPDDNQGIHDHLKQLIFSANDAATRLNAIAPPPTQTNLGGQTAFVRNPAIGNPQLVGTISNTLPPTQGRVNPDLSQSTVGGTQPTITGDITGPAGQQPSPTGGAAAAPPPAATATPGPSATTTPTGGPVITAPPPGAAEAAATQAKLSGQQYAALQASAENIPQQAALLANMRSLLNQFSGGPAAEIIKRGESFVNELTGLKLGASEAAAYDSFQKQATQLAQQTFGALGGTGTDAKLDSAMHTNPSGFLSNMSNKEITALLQGNLDALKAKAAAGQAYMQAHGPTSFGQFQTEFNQHFDPRVFQITHLDAASRSQMLADMSKNERKDFLKAFSYAESQGWVDRNKLQGE